MLTAADWLMEMLWPAMMAVVARAKPVLASAASVRVAGPLPVTGRVRLLTRTHEASVAALHEQEAAVSSVMVAVEAVAGNVTPVGETE